MSKRGTVVSTAAVAVLLAVGGFAMAKTAPKAVHKDVIMPADAMKWEAGPLKGVQVAQLWGDWSKGGPYGVLVKFEAGVMNPLHKHTHTLKIVVLSGTFVHQPKGGVEEKVGPGGYLLQAGGQYHVSGCAPGAECEFFMTSTDKFDLIPAEKPAEEKK